MPCDPVTPNQYPIVKVNPKNKTPNQYPIVKVNTKSDKTRRIRHTTFHGILVLPLFYMNINIQK